MTFVHFVSLNWLIMYVAMASAALSIWQYKKTKGTMPLFSAIAWAFVAGVSAFGLWALE